MSVRVQPLIFNGENVLALLAGQKSQTRRVLNPQPSYEPVDFVGRILGFKQRRGPGFWIYPNAEDYIVAECPYGKPGDLLWVRETWCVDYDARTARPVEPRAALYAATEKEHVVECDGDGWTVVNKDGTERSPWKSPMFMPRWASRLTLRLTDVRVQRVQDISEEDARAEGAPLGECTDDAPCHAQGFIDLWNAINAKRGHGWDVNPWVWALSFYVLQANIDRVLIKEPS